MTKRLAVLMTLALASVFFGYTTNAVADGETPAAKVHSCDGQTRGFRENTSSVGTGEFQWGVTLWYQRCIYADGSGHVFGRNRVNGLRICMTRLKENDFWYDGWKVNPNVIGNWNPPTLTFPNNEVQPKTICKTWGKGKDAETWVNAGAPENLRCIGADLEQRRELGQNWHGKTASVCMTFKDV